MTKFNVIFFNNMLRSSLDSTKSMETYNQSTKYKIKKNDTALKKTT